VTAGRGDHRVQPDETKGEDVRRGQKFGLAVAAAALTVVGTAPAMTVDVHHRHDHRAGPLHARVTTTIFWVGEKADADNGGIPNLASAWDDDWQRHFGGLDDPRHRAGYRPAAFAPRENAFYAALPYNDYDGKGRRKRDAAKRCPHGCKNRWIRVIHGRKVAYAQWEDVGPFGEDDVAYVFGNHRPRSRINRHAGLDVSPAVRDYLGLDDIDTTAWQFVSAAAVPRGPWSTTVTTRRVTWR
jgi:hypothetical protein